MREQNGWIQYEFLDNENILRQVVKQLHIEDGFVLYKSESSMKRMIRQGRSIYEASNNRVDINGYVGNKERNGTLTCRCGRWVNHRERACWHLQDMFASDDLDVGKKIGMLAERERNGKDVMLIVKKSPLTKLYNILNKY